MSFHGHMTAPSDGQLIGFLYFPDGIDALRLQLGVNGLCVTTIHAFLRFCLITCLPAGGMFMVMVSSSLRNEFRPFLKTSYTQIYIYKQFPKLN